MDDDEKEFEETRRCLVNSYHSYIQTHAGYLIAIIIGGSALVAEWKNFWYGAVTEIIFVLLLIGIVFGFLFMGLRIFYWTLYANHALVLSKDQVLTYYTEYNKRKPYPFAGKAPYILMFQTTITHTAHEMKKRTKPYTIQGLAPRLALWLARSKDPDEENELK